MKPPVHSIGVRTPLVDGVEKVTGRARYTADLAPGPALVGLIGRSAVAHARIAAIDTQAARAMPGVRAVITGDDFSAPYGVIPISQNEWPLARPPRLARAALPPALRPLAAPPPPAPPPRPPAQTPTP